MKASRSSCLMQTFNPNPAAFELFCSGIVHDGAAEVQQALLSTTAATTLSWLQATNSQGHNLLQHAAQQGHLAALQPILGFRDFPVQLPLANRQQFVALLQGAAGTAAVAGHQALAELLQEQHRSHADICAVSTPATSCPVLYQAARLGDLPATQLLLSGGAFDSLIECPAPASTAAPSAGSCAHACTTWTDAPTSALEAAIRVGSAPLIQLLLSASTPAQLSDDYGFSALSYAVKNSASLQIVQMLLDAGAAVIDSSRTACVLTTAVQHASFEVTSGILAAAQRAMATDVSSNSNDSIEDGSNDSGTGLSASVMQHAVCFAVTADRADIAGLLLQTQDPALAEPEFLSRALCLAAELKDSAFARLLLKHGAAAVINTASLGCTPLQVAIINTSTAVMHLLLDAGADPSIKSRGDGRTALQQAMQHALRNACDTSLTSTAPFDCLLSHSSQPLSAAELVSTAWSLAGSEHWGVRFVDVPVPGMFGVYQRMLAVNQQHAHDRNMPAWIDMSDDEEPDSDEEWANEVSACKQDAQHSMLCSLLRAAAAKDSTAAQAALTACRQQIQELYEEAKSNHQGEGCTCGCCTPAAVDPDLILRARVMLRAMSEVWLNSRPVDLAAQRSAVQHMLVSATASLKQLQYLQGQHKAEVAAQAASMADREAVLALREQQVEEREQQVERREAQVRAREEALEKKPLAAAAEKRRKRL